MSNEPNPPAAAPAAPGIPPAAVGETDSQAAAAVLAELSGIVGGTTEDPGAAGDPPQTAIDPDTVPVLKQTQRQQRAARNRAILAERAEQEAADKEQALVNAGAVGSVTNMPEDLIPRDADGNPLWYFNPTVGRAVQATYMLNDPAYRRRKGLVPCMPPEDQIIAEEELPPVE